jgi:uncharacterized protein
MMDTEQKTFIQPRKLANKNGELRYNWKVEEFSRLDGLLYSNQGEINVHLVGRHDERRRCLVEANITANVQLECQTSFEPIDYQVNTKIVYCTVTSEEQIVDLDEEYEALLIEDGQVDIKQVIEDELILSLPIIANRASEELGVKMSYGDLPQEVEIKKNPFLVLEGLDLKGLDLKEPDLKSKQTKN